MVIALLAVVLSMTACAAPQQPQTTQPTATMPAADNTTAPAIPEEPEAEEPITPQKPADPPKPAGCQHKNTTFVEDVEPPTCMEYGYFNATLCADCGKLLDYDNRYWYSATGSTRLPTEHLCIMGCSVGYDPQRA